MKLSTFISLYSIKYKKYELINVRTANLNRYYKGQSNEILWAPGSYLLIKSTPQLHYTGGIRNTMLRYLNRDSGYEFMNPLNRRT